MPSSHCYITVLMQETLQALIHAFVLNEFLINTSHQLLASYCVEFSFSIRSVSRRVRFLLTVSYCSATMLILLSDSTTPHLPDIRTIDGVLNLLSVAILCFLRNVLDFRTYRAHNQHELIPLTDAQLYLMNTSDVNCISYNGRQSCGGLILHV